RGSPASRGPAGGGAVQVNGRNLTDPGAPPASGLTVADVARRYRVSPDKVRAWIRRGELVAVNTATALCGRPRWVVVPTARAELGRGRAGGAAPRAPRRRNRTDFVDYLPD